jgi:hypothetical protein
MPFAGYWNQAMLLPNGKVLVAGGSVNDSALFNPATEKWTMTSQWFPGAEYSTVTLLLNGQVMIAGGGGISSSDVALYDVGLGFTNSWQPQITAITSPLDNGWCLKLTGSQFRGVSEGSCGNTQDSPADYPVVQLRSLANEQTVFLLTTNWSTNSFTSVPVTGLPPGWMLATVFVNGIPSTSSILYLGPILLTSPTKPPEGAFQFNFVNTPGVGFTALCTTNLSLPMSDWTVLGSVTEVSAGQFQFTDLQATNSPQCFYRVRSP